MAVIVKNVFGCLSLMNGCRLIGLLYMVWAFFNYIFNLASFASPNFAILVNYKMLPERIDTFGRMWYAMSALSFWIVHIVVDILLFVGVTKNQVLLLSPFVFWCFVGALWETFFVLLQLMEYESGIQILIIIYSLIINIALPIYFALCVISYAEVMREGQIPSDAIVLKNAKASSQENLAANNKGSGAPGAQGNFMTSSVNSSRRSSLINSQR